MSHVMTPERWMLLLVLALAVGVTLGMFAQSWRYRAEFDEVYATIDRNLGINAENMVDPAPMPESMRDLDPSHYRDASPGLNARQEELKEKGYPGTQDIPVITDKMTKEDVTGDTVEGPVVTGPVPSEGLWPPDDTLTATAPGEYQPWGPRTTMDIVDEIEARIKLEMREEALVSR